MPRDRISAKQSYGNLSFSTAQKVIDKLLTNNRLKTDLDDGIIEGVVIDAGKVKLPPFTKEELIKKLGITSKNFDNLKLLKHRRKIIKKITLPLVRLYCATKFVDQ